MSFRVKLSDEDIADFEVVRDVAMATIFGFLYMGCTLAPPEEYEKTTEPSMCGGDGALCQINCLDFFPEEVSLQVNYITWLLETLHIIQTDNLS